MKKKLLTSILALLVYSIFYSQENQKVKLFKTSKEVVVTVNDSIDLDKYKDFIVIPSGKAFSDYFRKIAYFKEVISYPQLVKNMKAEKSGELKTNKYEKYYKNEKESLTLYLNMYDDYYELSLGKFGVGAIFTVKAKMHKNLIGINAGSTSFEPGTLNAMMNELVNFIIANSKTYKVPM